MSLRIKSYLIFTHFLIFIFSVHSKQEIVDDYQLADEICKKAGPLRSTIEPPYLCVCEHGYTRHDGICVKTQQAPDPDSRTLGELDGSELERLRETAAVVRARNEQDSSSDSSSSSVQQHNDVKQVSDTMPENIQHVVHSQRTHNPVPKIQHHAKYPGGYRPDFRAPLDMRNNDFLRHRVEPEGDFFEAPQIRQDQPEEKYSFEFPSEELNEEEPREVDENMLPYAMRESLHNGHRFGDVDMGDNGANVQVSDNREYAHPKYQYMKHRPEHESIILSTLAQRDGQGHVVSDNPMKTQQQQHVSDNTKKTEMGDNATNKKMSDNEKEVEVVPPPRFEHLRDDKMADDRHAKYRDVASMADVYFLDDSRTETIPVNNQDKNIELSVQSSNNEELSILRDASETSGNDVSTNRQDEAPAPKAEAQSSHVDKKAEEDSEYMDTNTMYLMAVVAACSIAGMVGLVVAGVCWYRLQRGVKASAEAEYPAYGVTGPGAGRNEKLGSPGDRKLAQSAQMYHYQHQKQQMLAMEKANGDMGGQGSDLDSDEENEEGDYTVYECPGLAPTGEMEVKNPLFSEDTPTVTPGVTPSNGHHP